MPSIFLDPTNKAIPPEDHILVETEVAFLIYATSEHSLFIRGQRLCSWAKEFYDGRNIPCKTAVSPISDLVGTFIGLRSEDARIICERLGSKISTLEKFSALDIMDASYPTHLWGAIPSKKHAAEWLLWLDETNPENAFWPILSVLITDWKQAAPDWAEIYDIHTVASASDMIGKWLGSEITPYLHKLGEFPLPVPDRWIELLKQSWRKEILKTEGDFLGQFLQTSTPWYFKQEVALVALSYFESNLSKGNFTEERYDQIARFVSGPDRSRLLAIKPVPMPGNLPNTVDAVS